MMTCAVTTSFLGTLATLALFMRYVWGFDIAAGYKIALFIGFVCAGCLPLMTSYALEPVLGSAFAGYRLTLYFIFIFCIILLSLTVLRDLVWFFAYEVGRLAGKEFIVSPFTKAWVLKANFVTIGVSFLAALFSVYAGLKVPDIKNVQIASDKITQSQKIVFLSDLHIHRVICPEKIRKIVENTNAQNPNIIILGGDIIDDDVERVEKIADLLKGLKAKQGIYFVTGNHEFYAGYKQSIAALQKYGFILLENDSVLLNGIFLAGVPDVFTGKSFGKKAEIEQVYANAPQESFTILISHSPLVLDKNLFDLQIAGHTHGGQIFPFHIFAKLHNKYLAGLYKTPENTSVYVSRGAGQWGPQMRFLAPAEITVLSLEPEK